MTLEDLHLAERILDKGHKIQLHNLRQRYAEDNAEFKVGDFVFNVTGIIKIDKIGYDVFKGSAQVTYTGLRYKKANGVFSRTKDRQPSTLVYSLKLIENPIVE